MPVLHEYRGGHACYIRTKVGGAIITFQVTLEGLRRLRSASVTLGVPFSRWLLSELYRSLSGTLLKC
jgi:hypothetical protein